MVDAIVNEDKISTFDKRPGDMSIEVGFEISFGFLIYICDFISKILQDKHLLSRLLLILGGNSSNVTVLNIIANLLSYDYLLPL